MLVKIMKNFVLVLLEYIKDFLDNYLSIHYSIQEEDSKVDSKY